MTRPIRVGVVGCGEIAQIMHLRFLDELPEFAIVALCDLSETVLATLGERYRVPHLLTDYARLAELPTSTSSRCARQIMSAGPGGLRRRQARVL